MSPSSAEIRWSPAPLVVTLSVADGPPGLSRVQVREQVVIAAAAPLPLVELGLAGTGRFWSGRRYIDSVGGRRLSYLRHQIDQTTHASGSPSPAWTRTPA